MVTFKYHEIGQPAMVQYGKHNDLNVRQCRNVPYAEMRSLFGMQTCANMTQKCTTGKNVHV